MAFEDLTNWNLENCPLLSLVDGSSDYWTESTEQANEYYETNEQPGTKPKAVYIDGDQATEGTLGSLGQGEWAYGDNDSLGYDTVYVRLSDDSDPDSKSEDYVQCTEPQLLAQPASGYKAIINNLTVSNIGTENGLYDVLRWASDNTVLATITELAQTASDSPYQFDKVVCLDDQQQILIHADIEDISVWADGAEKDVS